MILATDMSFEQNAPRRAARRQVFGDCSVDRDQRILLVAGERRQLEPKAFSLLLYLIDHRDRVVSRDELLREIWKTEYLSESVTARAVMKVRRALGDEDDNPVIETLYRVGYRFAREIAGNPEEADKSVGANDAVSNIDEGGRTMVPPTPIAPDMFIAEALSRYSAAIGEQRYSAALKYIEVCMPEGSMSLYHEVDEVARLAAAFDASTPFKAAAVLATATDRGDLLAQAKLLCVWASYHQFSGHQSRARNLANQAMLCVTQAQRRGDTAVRAPQPNPSSDIRTFSRDVSVYSRAANYTPVAAFA